MVVFKVSNNDVVSKNIFKRNTPMRELTNLFICSKNVHNLTENRIGIKSKKMSKKFL